MIPYGKQSLDESDYESVAKVLRDNAKGLAARAGRGIALTAVCARDAKKDRGLDLSGIAFEKDPLALASRADVDVVDEDGPFVFEGFFRDAVFEADLALGPPFLVNTKAGF